MDERGNLYIADWGNQRIRKVAADGVITTVAGNGDIGFSGDGGPATAAPLGNPSAVAVDGIGNVYIADTTNNRVRRIPSDGLITTIAGNGTTGFAGDGGLATSAQISGATSSVALDEAGAVYIADTANNRIRKITADGVIHTIAGDGVRGFAGDGGPAAAARLDRPSDMVLDANGAIYVADRGNGSVRKITADGIITTVAGVGSSNCVSPDGGAASSTPLCGPRGIALGSHGELYIADNSRIRKVGVDGVIVTIAGGGADTGDGGAALSAQLFDPTGVVVDGNGNVYISENGDHRIRKVTPDGVITTVAGTRQCGYSGDGGLAASAQICSPIGIAMDKSGALYVAEFLNQRVRKITAAGLISTVAGNGVWGFSGDGGLAVSAQLDEPYDVAVDGAGNVYIADMRNSRIRKVSPASTAQSFNIANSGAAYWATIGASAPITIGYARLQTAPGAIPPTGVAIFSYRSNGVLVSETSTPVSGLFQSGRIYAGSDASVRTGIALANPNAEDAVISFYFTDKDGVTLNSGVTTIPPRQQIAAFLDEAPFHGNGKAQSFTFASTTPVGAIALRGRRNERGDFLMTTLPVAPASAAVTGDIVLPHFAAGAGWTTQILLVNPTDAPLSGSVVMDAPYPYTIAPRSAARIVSSNPGLLSTGLVRVIPAPGNPSPVASSVFTLVQAGITVTENGIATTGVAQSFRIFAENDSGHALQTGIAIANTESSPATVQFELLGLNGQPSGYSGSTTIAANGHLAVFLKEIPGFANLPSSFRGVLRVSSSTAISTIGLRTRYNERADFLISTMPAIGENLAMRPANFIFPEVVAGDGYTTEFILMNSGGAAQGSLSLTSQAGTDWPLQLTQ